LDIAGATVIHDAENVVLHDLDTDHPTVTFTQNGQKQIVDADFMAQAGKLFRALFAMNTN
jgi:p-hydroxybenzoate 3-monooxygenase